MQNTLLTQAADTIRILTAAMVQKAKSGHPGGAMGAADFMTLVFAEFLRWDPEDPHWVARDRFFMDPGHMSPLLYSLLHLTGRMEMDQLPNFRQLHSHTPGHPEMDVAVGIENTSGPLGMGHAIALGAAIGERFMQHRFGAVVAHKTFVLISDGGIQEEVAYGVGRMAGHLGLNDFVMFYDSNKVQLSSSTDAVMSHDIPAQYRAWGWKVLEVDPYDMDASRTVLREAWAETAKPVLIIGHTVMGKGARDKEGALFEGKVSTHGQPLDPAGASTEATIRALGGDPANPFQVPAAVRDAFALRLQELRVQASEWKQAYAAWSQSNASLATTLERWLNQSGGRIDLSSLPQKPGVATRVSSGTVLAWMADHMGNAICSSADLSNSDNTQAFLDRTGYFKPGDFSGAFVQVGVSELTMASIANGIAIHGGLVPVCATFFVFSDFMKPAMRLAALMGLPVKYVFTHDSFRVGEDGPTHQPIEHEAQIRLLEGLRRADGLPEMLVLRPSDYAETTVAWEMALENTRTPTALVLTRQNVAPLPILPSQTDRIQAAAGARRGAYVVSGESATPDLTFVANGSDVQLCESAAEELRKQGLAVRVVSMISPALFLHQDLAYRETVVPVHRPVLALSSGLPLVFDKAVGPLGRTLGLERFGASGPFNVLEEYFGFTVEALCGKAQQYLVDFKAHCQAIQAHLK